MYEDIIFESSSSYVQGVKLGYYLLAAFSFVLSIILIKGNYINIIQFIVLNSFTLLEAYLGYSVRHVKLTYNGIYAKGLFVPEKFISWKDVRIVKREILGWGNGAGVYLKSRNILKRRISFPAADDTIEYINSRIGR